MLTYWTVMASSANFDDRRHYGVHPELESPQGKFTLWDHFDIMFSTLCWEERIANKVWKPCVRWANPPCWFPTRCKTRKCMITSVRTMDQTQNINWPCDGKPTQGVFVSCEKFTLPCMVGLPSLSFPIRFLFHNGTSSAVSALLASDTGGGRRRRRTIGAHCTETNEMSRRSTNLYIERLFSQQ